MHEQLAPNEWKGRTAVLATMHGKERVIAPELEQALGIHISLPHNFNTDQFGTFTRDIPRTGNQLETARKKALAAMEVTGCTLGIASEGSFSTHPTLPFLSSNLEIVVLIDTQERLEIVGHYRSNDIMVRGQTAKSVAEAKQIALSWGFPRQGVIIRQSEHSNANIYKEIKTIDELEVISSRLLAKPLTSSIFLETDMRAHRCPSRMEAIRLATLDLIQNCLRLCPSCHTPGFVITSTVRGLPCSSCGLPTDLVKESVYSCQKCHYSEKKPLEGKAYAEPSECPWCNP